MRPSILAFELGPARKATKPSAVFLMLQKPVARLAVLPSCMAARKTMLKAAAVNLELRMDISQKIVPARFVTGPCFDNASREAVDVSIVYSFKRRISEGEYSSKPRRPEGELF